MVEVPPPPTTASWRVSSASGASGCVQIAHSQEYFWVRDSKNPHGPTLGVTPKGWAVFIIGVHRDEFDCYEHPVR